MTMTETERQQCEADLQAAFADAEYAGVLKPAADTPRSRYWSSRQAQVAAAAAANDQAKLDALRHEMEKTATLEHRALRAGIRPDLIGNRQAQAARPSLTRTRSTGGSGASDWLTRGTRTVTVGAPPAAAVQSTAGSAPAEYLSLADEVKARRAALLAKMLGAA